MFKYQFIAMSLALGLIPRASIAHDTWVQTNTNVVRSGDMVLVDLMLGNHGNEHRDFKLANKITLEHSTLHVFAPDGKQYDLKDRLVDTGYAPREGYWSAKFVAEKPGLYMAVHTLDKLHRTTRAIKSAKTFFVISPSLDKVSPDYQGFNRPLGHPLEIVPVAHPVTPMGPGKPISVQVLYEGKPLVDSLVTFIPRGTTLEEGFDPQFERQTDTAGKASFTPTEGNYVLVVVHHREPEQKGEGYDGTSYSATLTVFVPELCPCCE
jgi:uncharacterized GH25 family protein